MKGGVLVVAAVMALGLASCASQRSPVELRAGPVLSDAPGAAAVDRVLVIGVEGRSVSRLPLGVGRPLASGATLITGPSNEPLAASPSPAERLLLVDTYADLPREGGSGEFGWVTALAGQRVIVPAGCVGVLRIGAAPPDGAEESPPLVELLVQAGEVRPLLTLRAERDPSEEEVALGGAGAPREARVQMLRVDWPLDQTDGAFILGVPAAPDRGVPGATLWRLSVREAVAGSAEADEARALAESLRAKAAPTVVAAPWPSMARALREAKGAGAQRAALAFAAVDTGADLTAEAASLAEDTVVAALVAGAAEALDRAPGAASAELVGWSLDRATILTLAGLNAESALARVLGSVLSARYGEVGRDPAALGDLARRCGSAPEMEARLEAEHLILLDDASPALRVRSYDWLASRGAAPAGYDPLGPANERRAAVDQHLQAEEKP